MPIYIPSSDGFFAFSLEVFRISLRSLLATVDREYVSITIIDNACIPEAADLIDEAVAAGQIDRLVRNTTNRGKPDAVASELRGSYESFVTLVDADVLFLPGWLSEVEKVFMVWPNAGAVSPSPQPKLVFYQNICTWIYGLLAGQIRRSKFVIDEDMLQFAYSVGNPALYSKHELDEQFGLVRNGQHALIGAGHFVITLRRSCYSDFTYDPRLEGTGTGMRMIDAPADRKGWLRLSTTRAHVLHMGNTPESWMQVRLNEVERSSLISLSPDNQSLRSDNCFMALLLRLSIILISRAFSFVFVFSAVKKFLKEKLSKLSDYR